jgi:Transmembrane secretion effector
VWLGRWQELSFGWTARDPGWVRGRMNSFQIVLGQGSIAVGALLWGSEIANIGPELTFGAAAALALVVLALGHRFSIDFAAGASVDAAPLNPRYAFPFCPHRNDGPVTITIKYAIASEDRERFYALMQEVQATIRRNGSFRCRLDESLDQPGLFRLEYLGRVSSPKHANDRGGDTSFQYSPGHALGKLETDRALLSFNSEIPHFERFWH